MADWYYIGHYGQLGPMSRDQIDDLISGGVITRETFVWCTGMPAWLAASDVRELQGSLNQVEVLTPPPPPMQPVYSPTPPQIQPTMAMPQSAPLYRDNLSQNFLTSMPTIKSDRSRVAGGVLNLLLPGVGRMYLGYGAYGVLQLFVTLATCGVGAIWPFVDGICILAGTVKMDGYGRVLD